MCNRQNKIYTVHYLLVAQLTKNKVQDGHHNIHVGQ